LTAFAVTRPRAGLFELDLTATCQPSPSRGGGLAPTLLEVLQHLAGRVVSGQSSDAAARMRACAAHIEAAQRPAVIAVAEHRARREHLPEIERAVEDVAADKAEGALEVERREDLPPDHRTAEVRRVAVDRVDHQVGDRLAVVVPGRAVGEL